MKIIRFLVIPMFNTCELVGYGIASGLMWRSHDAAAWMFLAATFVVSIAFEFLVKGEEA